MESLFRKFLNLIGIKTNKLVSEQSDDLIEDDKSPVSYADMGLYLKKGDKGDGVRLLQMALRKEITHVIDQEDIDLCGSILSSTIKGVNSQQYDYIVSIMNDSKAIKIADMYKGLDSYGKAIVKMCNYVNTDMEVSGNFLAPTFVSYVMHTAYPTWKFKSPKVYKWLAQLPKGTYTRQIKSLDKLKYEKVYIGGWSDVSGDGHIFFIDPIETAKGSFNAIHTIEANTYADGSARNYTVSRRVRKFHTGSKIKIFEITV